MVANSTPAATRRHDLDALRAFAMLLGILLHGSMSFIPGAGVLWGVQDSQSSWVYLDLLASIHGWRMPLFFVISGFFTTMLWKKRGLQALLRHRFKRIFLPLLCSMLTVIPTMGIVSEYLRPQESPTPSSDINIWAAVATNDQSTLKFYLDQGGDVLARDPYGSTPLHVACLFGRAEAAKLLLNANADLRILNNEGQRPEDLLQIDWGTTAFIAQSVQLAVKKEDVLAGREEIERSLNQMKTRSVTARPEAGDNTAGETGLFTLLFQLPVFFHLWFLWFLCWYVVGFALIVKILQRLQAPAIPSKCLTSGLRYLWLIPLAAVPQFFMATEKHAYGPDTSVGLLPLPAVFAYYGIFFGFGAMYYGASEEDVVVGRGSWWKLAFAILFLFPFGLSLQGPDSIGQRILFAVMQTSYTWVMSFGMIGLFHRFFRTHRFWVRYLSDSSYWLYLVHIPLLMVLQFLVSDWQLPSFIKLVLVCVSTTTLLLLSYQLCVRNTWIGWLLNGRRYPRRQTQPYDQPVVADDEPNVPQEPTP